MEPLRHTSADTESLVVRQDPTSAGFRPVRNDIGSSEALSEPSHAAMETWVARSAGPYPSFLTAPVCFVFFVCGLGPAGGFLLAIVFEGKYRWWYVVTSSNSASTSLRTNTTPEMTDSPWSIPSWTPTSSATRATCRDLEPS